MEFLSEYVSLRTKDGIFELGGRGGTVSEQSLRNTAISPNLSKLIGDIGVFRADSDV